MGTGPIRTCVCCRERKEKHRLIRMVLKEEGKVVFDLSGREQGRGAYVCKDGACIKELARHKKAISRVLKGEVRTICDILNNQEQSGG